MTEREEMSNFMKRYNVMKIARGRVQSETTTVGYIPSQNTSYGKKLTAYEEKRDNKDYEHFNLEDLVTFFREQAAKAKVSYRGIKSSDRASFSKLLKEFTKKEIAEIILWVYTSKQKSQNKQTFMPCWINNNMYQNTQKWLKNGNSKSTKLEYREIKGKDNTTGLKDKFDW